MIGLDVEWKPTHIGGAGKCPASLLQVRDEGAAHKPVLLCAPGGYLKYSMATDAGVTGLGLRMHLLFAELHFLPKAVGRNAALVCTLSVCLWLPNGLVVVQVATESHVLIFDLLTLGGMPELDACLCSTFHNKVRLGIPLSC